MTWHEKTVAEVLSELRTTADGLSVAEAKQRLAAHGPNEIIRKRPRSNLALLFSQFKSPLIVILFAAAAISFFFAAVKDGWIILAVVLFNGLVGFFQEGRASRAMERLRSLNVQRVRVIRGGEELEISAEHLVVGDVVVLEAGSTVPADGRIVGAVNLKVMEAVFTGESVPVEKWIRPAPPGTPALERHNLAWRATTIAAGRGKMVVTETGMATRFGQIVREVAHIPESPTPFQQQISSFAKRLAVVIVALSVGVTMLSILRGFAFEQSVLLGISLVVSLIPEGLPVIITLTFAWGMWQMAKRHALVRKLVAVETLGAVTVIASDKTGTLTFGEMMVEEVVLETRRIVVTGEGYRPVGNFLEHETTIAPLADSGMRRLLEVGMLCNDSRLSRDEDNQDRWIGDPTEISLIVMGEKAGLRHFDLDRAFPRVGEFPFDFSLKYMVTFHTMSNGQHLVAVKGAPRQILELCSHKQTAQSVTTMTADDRQAVRQKFERLAERSLRGLALAYAETADDWRTIHHEHLKNRLIFLGLVGIRDPIRSEAPATVAATQAAGIRVVMLTGDYRLTAQTVAREIGILNGLDHNVVDGQELEAMDDRALQERVKTARVFSRVSPEQKLRIARALKANGDVIAMTGDGINDVPALTEANIGIAIGQSSSDAAKESADMVLTDGNLSNIVAAVEAGRSIFRNIQRVLIFILASNLAELFLILAAMAIGLPLPLLPLHIIWLNVITDPFLGIALAREPKGPHVMAERPRPPRAPILDAGHWVRIVVNGGLVAVSALAVFAMAYWQQRPPPQLFALTLTTVALGEWFVGLASRSARRSFVSGLTRNPLMIMALAAMLVMQISILYIPSFSRAFHLTALDASDWLLVVGAASLVLLVEEVRKAIRRSRKRRPSIP
ncbi:MAG: HAD-IC family P-type ATPase [Candidatus Kerfeldbacteria bacterium]|nr:HAD-IC family P-type ATPase [Candidatus Kerfeldbacteria bacterium]